MLHEKNDRMDPNIHKANNLSFLIKVALKMEIHQTIAITKQIIKL